MFEIWNGRNETWVLAPAAPPLNEFGGIRGQEVERQDGRERRCGVGGCVYIEGGAEFDYCGGM